MEIKSELFDKRIDANNILIEMSIGEYLALATPILTKNEFQRKRVRSASTVYALLRDDIVKGAIIPPIVLALNEQADRTDGADLLAIVQNHASQLVILDGLQRTYTLLDLVENLSNIGDSETLTRVVSQPLRVEVYVGLNRLGILYRMLTLNTGQTPMSLRQQIEILYLDYLEEDIEGIKLLREVDQRRAVALNEYSFKDMIEAFNAYLDRNPLPLDRADLLENIKSLHKLSQEVSADLFVDYVRCWIGLVSRMNEIFAEHQLLIDNPEGMSTEPFGRTVVQVLKKPQAMSGFGAAIGKLRDIDSKVDFGHIVALTAQIVVDDQNEFLEQLNQNLNWIKANAKKIGNAQREYFYWFFRELFSESSDSYLNLMLSAESSMHKYKSLN